MPERGLAAILDQVRRTAAASGVSDVQLLARFTRDRDEAAFELLVWRSSRHGGQPAGAGARATSQPPDPARLGAGGRGVAARSGAGDGGFALADSADGTGRSG